MIVDLHPNHKRFAEIFARLWKEQRTKGVKNPRVGRMAAMMAGYGAQSWNETNAVLTADVMFNKLVKRQDVLQYLRELGIERIGRQWREVDRPETA